MFPISSPSSSKRNLLTTPTGSSSRRSLFMFSSYESTASTTSTSAVTSEEKGKIFKWVMSDECKTRDDLNKYEEPSFTVASRMFDICKSTELDCLFVELRAQLDERKLCILAFAHSETTFDSPEMAMSYLRASKRKMVQGPSQGSLGSLSLARNDVTIYSFVMSQGCQSLTDIDQKFTLREEIDRARAMFEVSKDLTPGNIFIEARAKWTEEQLSFVAKEHANRPFLSIESANNYLELVEKKGLAYRSFSNYLPAAVPVELESAPAASSVKPLYLP